MSTQIFPSRKSSRKDEPLTLPTLQMGESIPESSAPHPPPNPPANNSPLPPTNAGGQTGDQSDKAHFRLLPESEWVQFCHSIGVMDDSESNTVIRPTCCYWPAKGFPDGLYRDVLSEKAKYNYLFHFLSTTRWVVMLVQLAIGAVLTALGSIPQKDGMVITILAAINTCLAGLLALLHNSGLPDRFRLDRTEFYKLEEYMKEIIDTKLVPTDEDILETIASCYRKFQTVQNNIPASYTPAAPIPGPTPKTHPPPAANPTPVTDPNPVMALKK